MKIPQKIEIEIINENNKIIETELLLGLKIFSSDENYHNFSMFKTNKNGKIIVNQNDIINNTELKHDVNIQNFITEKIELYLWDCKALNSYFNYFKSIRNVLEQDNFDQILKTDLMKRGFSEFETKKYIESTRIQMNESLKIYHVIKNVKNCKYKTVNIIQDKWEDDSIKKYQLIVKKKL